MSDPSPAVRAATYERDQHRCASCGAIEGLQYQHRAVEGQGGRKARPAIEDGLTSCVTCNPAYEHRLQRLALARGWKVRTWVRDRGLSARVPVFYVWERQWRQLTSTGLRVPVTPTVAMGLMRQVYGPAWDEMKKGLAA